MDDTMKSCREFVAVLASSAPAPGGGGAAALAAALGTALGNMVAALTVGKKNYADVEEELRGLMTRCEQLQNELLDQVAADKEGFLPLARAYGIPKDDPARAEVLEAATLTACAAPEEVETRPKQYQATFLDVFDTVTTVMGYAESQEVFTETAEMAHDLLLEYHQLYDIYNDYEGIHNLKTVNDQAGIAPVTVDARILDLLLLCRDLYADSGGKVNAAMGSVLLLWHEAREASVNDPEHAYLPEEDAIQAALEHTSFDNVVLDEAASTVYLTDPAQRLDVGAVAKGYAAGAVAAALPTGMVLSLGGNVCVTGPKPDGSPWVIGVQNPDGDDTEYVQRLDITSGAVVTSGDYQRYYTVDGVAYHHIIDPDTGWPARHYRSVTVICADSGLADALSTAAFIMDEESGRILLETYGAEALWVYADGSASWTGGCDAYFHS